ncbi:putative O-glycosylation ligase, exosortase A system-associated [Paucibacter sp. XJ19-41]|uniref:putative O-glycosylation ligase, exosortase A system-associated n=1 Tax=Paucibacter sp. XJ19-41 TaxID=2927824 RepID=UPI002349429A|nr:putative O-glycosylation ligase, exosortase A system-associated [Paucibacter sp. XJ19-41]MDC6166101.1 putative O-glycosylation ligase, exosortase A system-associated [Paucibacter sp. XJ19-41]
MRDLIIIALVLAGSFAALRKPWIGILVWTWLSLMNPHRFAWGIAYDAPLAAISAACTLVGLFITRDRSSPFKGSPTIWLALFSVWLTISWLMGLDPNGEYYQWNKIFKINLMIFVALALLHSKAQIMTFAWVVIASIALLGLKGGVFTLASGGNFRVWGPPGSFIEDNNEFALSVIMTIPLLQFLRMQVSNRWLKWGLVATMLCCAASALGSHSRGGFLAISAMVLYFWWRGKNKLPMAIVFVLVGVLLLLFMPEHWTERMRSIDDYQEDDSAMGRIHAWVVAWNYALRHPFGAGFNLARPELFALYAPESGSTHAAHSIYFQVMGNHGFIGLLLYLGIWITTWRSASALIRLGKLNMQTKWCQDLGTMAQVSLLAYAVGGAFLSLAYFDLPYDLMVVVVCARVWLKKELWKTEPETAPRWLKLLGGGPAPKPLTP